MKWFVLLYSKSLWKQNAFWKLFTPFPVIKNTIERMAIENAFELFFNLFLFVNITAESPAYMATFFCLFYIAVTCIIPMIISKKKNDNA